MRKGRDGEKNGKKKWEKNGKKKEKRKKENTDENSGHYVVASSIPPERQRPNDDARTPLPERRRLNNNRWHAARSCQYHQSFI